MIVIRDLDSWQYNYEADTRINGNYRLYLIIAYMHSHKMEVIYQLAYRLLCKQTPDLNIRPYKYSQMRTYSIQNQVYRTSCPLFPAFPFFVFLLNIVPYFNPIRPFHIPKLLLLI